MRQGKYILIISTLLCCISLVATATDRSLRDKPYRHTAYKLLTGLHLQQAPREDDTSFYSRKLFEVGLHKTITSQGPYHPPGVFTHGASIEISPEKNPIYGFKYGAWAGAMGLVFGLNAVYYTDFHYGNFKIRPEFGFGIDNFKLTLGFNIPTISNKDFKEMRQSALQFSLNILFKVKTIKLVVDENYHPPQRRTIDITHYN